jgi:hypothetical protein
MGRDMDRDFILGMGKVGERVKILLDIEKVLVGDTGALERVNAGECEQQDGAAEQAEELAVATA